MDYFVMNSISFILDEAKGHKYYEQLLFSVPKEDRIQIEKDFNREANFYVEQGNKLYNIQYAKPELTVGTNPNYDTIYKAIKSYGLTDQQTNAILGAAHQGSIAGGLVMLGGSFGEMLTTQDAGQILKNLNRDGNLSKMVINKDGSVTYIGGQKIICDCDRSKGDNQQELYANNQANSKDYITAIFTMNVKKDGNYTINIDMAAKGKHGQQMLQDFSSIKSKQRKKSLKAINNNYQQLLDLNQVTFGQQFKAFIKASGRMAWEGAGIAKDLSLFLAKTAFWSPLSAPIKGLIRGGKIGLNSVEIGNLPDSGSFFVSDKKLEELFKKKSTQKLKGVEKTVIDQILETKKAMLEDYFFKKARGDVIGNDLDPLGLKQKRLRKEIKKLVKDLTDYQLRDQGEIELNINPNSFDNQTFVMYDNKSYKLNQKDTDEINKQVFTKLAYGFSDKAAHYIADAMSKIGMGFTLPTEVIAAAVGIAAKSIGSVIDLPLHTKSVENTVSKGYKNLKERVGKIKTTYQDSIKKERQKNKDQGKQV